MTTLPENIVEHCQSHGLRILCVEGFKFFYENIGRYPGNYLEIGVFEGFMLRELAEFYTDRHFYGIDPFIEDGNTSGHNDGVEKGKTTWKQMAQAHSNLDHLRNVTLFQETSRAWSERTDYQQVAAMNIGWVLVDGDHSYEEAFNDLLIARRVLVNGGVVFLDDAGLPSVKMALDDWIESDPGIISFKINGHAIIHLEPL